ncbi:hypothetical protein [Rhodococcus tibetensis]|uniref:Glycine zipper family protein n=1 Tax=Rhodococcus tibetensis TaxID=2965064 RepID=A0ABT1QK49_9NOCA|nr:hypothetical protein [Rhodococcus sp. FXJ9.536]MCQ4122175.1 hypothetical protein [Rhodococcus sp. FXJ9.536]
MKLLRTLALSIFVVAAMAVGAGTAYADPGTQGIDWSQPLLTPTAEGSSQVAEQFFPENDAKQSAFDNMTSEINTGWNNAGLQGMAIGSNVGMAIGCVSIFPNFIAGCIIGAVVGTIAGAVIGVGVGNPNAQPAVERFFATP